jgi:hypothetical protein
MQKSLKKSVYLHLRNHSMVQLRQAAKHHHRSVVEEATTILESTFRPDHGSGDAAQGPGGAEKLNANGLFVDLSEHLLERLRPLAERNYRSVAGEAANVLETVLSLAERESEIIDGSKPQPILKPILKFRKKPHSSKSAV